MIKIIISIGDNDYFSLCGSIRTIEKKYKRMKLGFVLLLGMLALAFPSHAKSDTTILYGNDANYINKTIEVYGYSDFITRKTILLAKDTVDSLGNFELQIPIQYTRLVQVPFDYYNGLLYVEPNEEYEIILPEYREKSFVDILNPYFQQVDFYLGIKNAKSTNINLLIFEFDDIYQRYIDENYYAIYTKPQEANVDAVIENIEKLYDTVPDSYFRNYRTYKYAVLKYVSYMRNSLYVSKDYFNDMPVSYQNTAYMDLFNQLYVNYLMFYGNSSEGERLYSDIALAKSPCLAKQTFSNNLDLTRDSVQELVLLKGLHDAFQFNDYPFNSMLIVLDSIAYSSKINEHKIIAQNIKEKVLHLREGYPAPDFELRDNLGLLRKRSDYLANYIYLNFCSVESFPCQQDFLLLKELHEKYKTEFKIISISIDEDFEKAKAYFKQNGFEWTLLSYNLEPEVLKEYKVRAYPTYYLIDPKGKMVMSPAASPGENFEYRFFTFMREVKRSEIRNKY